MNDPAAERIVVNPTQAYQWGRKDALTELRALIQSDLDGSQTLYADAPGLRKALLIIDRMEGRSVRNE
jgi:hypothetical protein